jgi:DHA2 family multidrug resistance protein-like MFS transporter
MATVHHRQRDDHHRRAARARAGAASAISETSSELSGALGIALLGSVGMVTAARGAFVDALQIIALASAGIVALAAIVAARILRATPTVTAAKAAAG